ncbi:hypothetical protein [Bradyrhizobium sp. McL0615]|uniref:hypothetical protein n=1 Tax=Bradyrhizobium sp. McL0615 TaxID=3415673 RepID=UPI003CF1F9D9
MSETRDEATGQFTPAEPLTGREGIEAAQGYVPFRPAAEEPAGELTVEEAAAELSASRTAESDVVTYSVLDGLDDNVTLTVEQAAEITSAEKAEKAKAAEEKAEAELRDEVDRHRGVEFENAIPAETKALIDSGVDPEVAKAIQHPQVREAIEQEFTRAEETRNQYSTGLENARVHALATLGEVVPHLAGLPPAQFEEGLALLSQVDPPAFQSAMNILGRTHAIAQAQQQDQQQRAQVEHQQIEAWAKSQDARLKTMGIEFTQEKANEVVSYAGDLGLTREQLGNAMLAHPILRSAEVQRMMADAAAYHRLQKAPAKAAPKDLPPVQRPGTSNKVPSSSPNAKIASLNKQLLTASGDRAARISAEIWGLERKARG